MKISRNSIDINEMKKYDKELYFTYKWKIQEELVLQMNLMGLQHHIPIICALWKNIIQKLTSHGIVSDMVFKKSVDVGVTGTKHKKRNNTPDYQRHGRLPTVNTYSRSLITIIRLSTSYTGKSTQTSNSWHHPKKYL